MKYLEVRDAGTFIPVVAFLPYEVSFAGLSEFALSDPARCRVIDYGLGRSGWPTVYQSAPPAIVVVRLDNVAAKSDPYEWPGGSRTMQAAHEEIRRRWGELRSGDVIDVEFFLGEKPTRKVSEALPAPVPETRTTFRYAPKYRPPGFATVPDGWRLVEKGTGGHFPLRGDLPEGKTVFGVVEYDRRLSDRDVETYELSIVGEGLGTVGG